MIAVVCKQHPAALCGVEQLPRIRRAFSPLFIGCDDGVPPLDKQPRQPVGHIFIQIEGGHSGGAVGGKASVDRRGVLSIVGERCLHRLL